MSVSHNNYMGVTLCVYLIFTFKCELVSCVFVSVGWGKDFLTRINPNLLVRKKPRHQGYNAHEISHIMMMIEDIALVPFVVSMKKNE